MAETETREQILAFARQLCQGSDADPGETAHRRRWLDAAGRPTAEGARLVAELAGQSGTRSAFRQPL